MRIDERDYVRSCRLYACCKPRERKYETHQRPRQPQDSWATIAVDLMGPYPRTRNGKENLLVVVTDLFSRWVEGFPLGSATAGKIVETLENNVFNRWEYLRSILSDNGPQFRSQQWNQAGRKWNTTPIYHSRANPTERRNQEIKTGLRLCLQDTSHRHWDKKRPQILFNLRSRKNAATGLTPSQVLFGKTIKRPGEWKFDPPGTQERTSPRIDKVKQHQAE